MTNQARPAHRPRWELSDIAVLLGTTSHGNAEVSGIAMNTADVCAGDLFCAVPGASTHGAAYAPAALAAGAVAVLTDAAGSRMLPDGVARIVVENPRKLLASLSASFYGQPADKLLMLGITGTQGKTTTSYLAESAWGPQRAALIGTTGTRVGGQTIPSTLTTPEAPALQGLFALMVERGIERCAMEVSSHALLAGRVDSVRFNTSIFLNLGHDHLDFHDTMEDYFAAKALLFEPERTDRAVINLDDPYGAELARRVRIPVVTYSLDRDDAMWRASDIVTGPVSSDFVVTGPDGETERFHVPLAGRFNVSNALAVVAALIDQGESLADVSERLSRSPGVPGRMERVENGRDLTVIVDYAHKPDALNAVLRSLRPVTAGRLITVIGAGGNRDVAKRPMMGRIGAELSDVLIVTDDNPRAEDPALIRQAVAAGATQGPAEVLNIADRRAAIEAALAMATVADTVVIAGKGHETGQEIAGVIHPFDDRAVVREVAGERDD